MKNLYDTSLLPIDEFEDLDECQACTGCYNNGDYIIDSICNGNLKESALFLIQICVSPYEFAEFVEAKEAEGFDMDWLDRKVLVNLTQKYYEMKTK